MIRQNNNAAVSITMVFVALLVVTGGVFAYQRIARGDQYRFDALLRHRADDVISVATSDDGTIDITAFQYAGDLNSFGMDIYIFYGDGKPLFAPEKRHVDGLPALIPLKGVRRGGETIDTISNAGGRTRVFTRAVARAQGDPAQVTMIVQVGRSAAPLTAMRAQQKTQMLVLGISGLVADLIGGLLLMRQLALPLQRSLAQQQKFVANAAHELRTPLSVIRATTELALMRTRSTEEYTVTLSTIERAAIQTGVMVENLLALAAVDAAIQPVETSPTDLAAITANVVREVTVSYPDTPITCVAKGDGIVQGNAALIHRLIFNLVDNACRYNPVGTPVHVEVRTQRRWVILAVRDEGTGIAAREMPHLFERFYRGEASRTSRQRGSGLGLSLVQQIATVHRGHVYAVSQVGQGTIITTFLPGAQKHPWAPRAKRGSPLHGFARSARDRKRQDPAVEVEVGQQMQGI